MSSSVGMPVERTRAIGHEGVATGTAILSGSLAYADVDVAELAYSLGQLARCLLHSLPRLKWRSYRESTPI